VSVQTAMSSSGSGRKEVTARSSRTVSINVVTLHRARLVHGWVTILGQINHLGANQGAQINSAWAFPPSVSEMSTSNSW